MLVLVSECNVCVCSGRLYVCTCVCVMSAVSIVLYVCSVGCMYVCVVAGPVCMSVCMCGRYVSQCVQPKVSFECMCVSACVSV